MPFDAASPAPVRTPPPPTQYCPAALNLLAAWRNGEPLLSFQRAVIRAALSRADRTGERINPAHIEAALAAGEFMERMES